MERADTQWLPCTCPHLFCQPGEPGHLFCALASLCRLATKLSWTIVKGWRLDIQRSWTSNSLEVSTYKPWKGWSTLENADIFSSLLSSLWPRLCWVYFSPPFQSQLPLSPRKGPPPFFFLLQDEIGTPLLWSSVILLVKRCPCFLLASYPHASYHISYCQSMDWKLSLSEQKKETKIPETVQLSRLGVIKPLSRARLKVLEGC